MPHLAQCAHWCGDNSQKNDGFPFGDARVNPCNHHALGLFALGPEQLLAVNMVIGDCLLAFVRNEPVDDLLAKLLLHVLMLARANRITPYWLNSSLSPRSAMTRSVLYLNAIHVTRSDIT